MALRSVLFLAAGALLVSAAPAACLSDAQAVELVDSFFAKTPAPTPEGLSEEDGACSRRKVNNLLSLRHGAVVGYKAGLTNPAVQKRFGTDHPTWGVLYDGMLLPGGSTVDAAFGARPLFEADLLVRVKSAAINHARTPAEVLDAIDQVIPFIELPDLVVQAPSKLNGAGVGAINVGARLGIVGQPLPVPATRGERYALLDALRDMTVRLTDGDGAELARGKGSDILGHPLEAVVWLAAALQKEERTLEVGQLISLGSFSPLLPPRPGLRVNAHYDGLPAAVPVSVGFR